jgi:hypothetical protein
VKFDVQVEQYWTYTIDADSPEEAVAELEYGHWPRGDCTGYSIEAVTNVGDYHGDDLRLDRPCSGGCGQQIPANRNDECTKCLLRRLESRQRARATQEDQ